MGSSNEPKFTVKQLVGIAAVFSAISGAGGAATVAANDSVQDERIATNARQIAELRGQMSVIAEATTKSTANVDNLKEDVKDIKIATEEIRRILMRDKRER